MGKKLTIYMLDGIPTGAMTVEIGNWSGKAIFSPLSKLKKIVERAEFDGPGVYFLKSASESSDFDDSIYIGEAEVLRARLKSHIANRDFESVICFISKDELLTKAHIKFLESKLISLAKAANTSKLENTNKPSLPRISEASKTVSDSISEGWIRLRTKLSDAGILVVKNDRLSFAEDAVFSSPSAASSVVLGRQSPGPIVWIDSHGRTYKENQEQISDETLD
ncbi:GIY-YIG nuclease family protein [Prosthecobacter fluviatilis]|uniref:GIY-YIG nuclease family protein n=1 Tax=Prosthecobacter fluviatilis TaxID=445931 RepID=A0ABW0KTX2_9BACT